MLENSESVRERAVAHAFAHARACEARMNAAEASAAALRAELEASQASRLRPTPALVRSLRAVSRLRRRPPADIQASEAPAPDTEPAQLLEPPLALPVEAGAAPLVSIVVTSYGHVQTTLACLASIAACWPRAAVEVIVVDDASGDPELGLLAAVPGLRLIDTGRNAGYGPACNFAAWQARGDFLLLLNNDTQVLPGWLDAMLDLMRDDQGVGAVGSKLLFPDGRLQEAGGIVWDDAQGCNVGRGEEPGLPAYNYVREVDYCSAACLLVRRDVFLGQGGFDPCYAPAYWEDADLAFRLRASGLRVLYQPRSEVIHHEGVSHGTDVACGVKALQPRNQKIFRERWRTVLEAEHFPPGRRLLRAKERSRRRIVLIADHYIPEPDRDAGSHAILSMIRSLQEEGCAVKLLPLAARADPRHLDPLREAGVEVLDAILHGRSDAWLLRHGEDLDAVIVSRPDVAAAVFGTARLRTAAPIFYFTVDLHFARIRAQAEMTNLPGGREAADAMERLERRIWRNVDAVLSLSEDETQVIRALEPGVACRTVTPFAFDRFADPRTPAANQDMLFVAGFAHPPNEDAAIWFAVDVLPQIRTRVPGARLRIVGSQPTAKVRALAGEGIEVAADVSAEELEAAHLAARVAVVPLRFGAGVKLKVVDALRHGLPLVTTPAGAQGLAGLADAARVAGSPEAFADMACELLTDDAAWCDRAARQIAYARARFSRAAHRTALLDAMRLDPERPSRWSPA